jgi:spore germination protein KC
MKKAGFLVLCILLSSSLAGCGFKDIDKRFFVVAMAIDQPEQTNKRYKVTIKLAIPSSSEKFGSNNFVLLSEETDSIASGIRVMKSKIDKEMDLGHMKMIIFGDKLVQKHDMKEVVDWFFRRRDIQKVAWVGIGKPDGQTILGLKPASERLPSNMLFMSFGQTGTETAYIVSEYLFDLRRRLYERGLDPVLPIIESRGDQQVRINSVGILDKKIIKMTLSPIDTKLFNSFYERVGKYDIFVPYGNGYFVISSEHVRGSYSIRDDKEGPLIRVNIKIKGGIEESDLHIQRNDIPQYEQQAAHAMKGRVTELLTRLQKAGVDPIGFGLRYRSRHFGGDSVWQQWTELYPKARFEVTVNIDLNSTGALG